jgi:hypothetical protein
MAAALPICSPEPNRKRRGHRAVLNVDESTLSARTIGFNPSMTKRERDAWDEEEIITRNHRELLKHGTHSLANFQRNWAYEKLPIFTARTKIAERLKLSKAMVAHLDLYPFRTTKQIKARAIFAGTRKKR